MLFEVKTGTGLNHVDAKAMGAARDGRCDVDPPGRRGAGTPPPRGARGRSIIAGVVLAVRGPGRGSAPSGTGSGGRAFTGIRRGRTVLRRLPVAGRSRERGGADAAGRRQHG